MKIGGQLHRPAIVESPNHNRGRTPKIFERIIASDSDLILFSNLAKETRQPNRSVDIPACEPIVGVLLHIAPRQLVIGPQFGFLSEPTELTKKHFGSFGVPLVELDRSEEHTSELQSLR